MLARKCKNTRSEEILFFGFFSMYPSKNNSTCLSLQLPPQSRRLQIIYYKITGFIGYTFYTFDTRKS